MERACEKRPRGAPYLYDVPAVTWTPSRKAAWEMMRQAAAKFGFSPSDRTAINATSLAPPDPAKQEEEDWLLRRGRFAVAR